MPPFNRRRKLHRNTGQLTLFALPNESTDPPLKYDVVTLSSPTHLALVADLTETPVSEIQALNPALLKSLAPQGYQLNVPPGSSNALLASLQTIPPERRASWRMHKVENGETLATIGKRYGAAPSVIAAANRMESDSPETGDLLVIPQAAIAPTVLRKPAPRRAAPAAAKKRTASKSRSKASPPVAKAGSKRSGAVGRT